VPRPAVSSVDQRGAHLGLLYVQAVQLFRPGRILPIAVGRADRVSEVDETYIYGIGGTAAGVKHRLMTSQITVKPRHRHGAARRRRQRHYEH